MKVLTATLALFFATSSAMALQEVQGSSPAPGVAIAGPTALPFADAPKALKQLPPGKVSVIFIHPITCCPVEVCFTLPCGCYEIESDTTLFGNKKLTFKYPGLCNDVVLKFTKDGGVKVKDKS